MLRKERLQNIIISLLSILFSFFVCHLVVWLIDPLGTYQYAYNAWLLRSHFIDHETGYSIEASRYDLLGYTVTILADGIRWTPDSNESSDCKLVFVGDSITFGTGVTDTATFANLTAQEFSANILNVGRSGYNASQVAAQMDYYDDADIYVWLAVPNDNKPPSLFEDMDVSTSAPPPNASSVFFYSLYVLSIEAEYQAIDEDISAFNTATESIFNHQNLIAFRYGDYFHDLPLIQINGYEPNNVSAFDKHPNARGHEILFEGMRPYLESFIETHCSN